MGALQGSITTRRYRVLGKVPADFRQTFHAAIRAHVLVPIDPARTEEASAGWCSIFDESDLNLGPSIYERDGHILLSMCVDTLKVDKAHLKRLLTKRQREIENERKEPLSAGSLRDLKAILSLELRQKTEPKIKTVDVVWDIDGETVTFYSLSKSMNEAFLALFARTFDLALDLDGPSAWAKDIAREGDTNAALSATKPTVELLQGFVGLRPGPRVLDEIQAVA